MGNFNFDFLKNVQVTAITPKAAKRVVADKLPTESDLRVFRSGKVYPSKAFAEKHQLEFAPKATLENPVDQGYGLDMFSSKDFSMLMTPLPREVVFVGFIPRGNAKISMWGTCSYEDDKVTPKASVFTQGSNSFAKKELVPMLSEVYGVDWERTEFVDFNVSEDPGHAIVSPNGRYAIPKTVSSGPRKGDLEDVSRRDIHLTILIPNSDFASVVPDVEESAPEVVVEDTVTEEEVQAIDVHDAVEVDVVTSELKATDPNESNGMFGSLPNVPAPTKPEAATPSIVGATDDVPTSNMFTDQPVSNDISYDEGGNWASDLAQTLPNNPE